MAQSLNRYMRRIVSMAAFVLLTSGLFPVCDDIAWGALSEEVPDWVSPIARRVIQTTCEGQSIPDKLRLTDQGGGTVGKDYYTQYLLSPDEDSVLIRAACGTREEQNLFVAQADSDTPDLVYRSRWGMFYPKWSPLGDQIALIQQHVDLLTAGLVDSEENDVKAYSLVVCDLGTAKAREVTPRWWNADIAPQMIDWSSDGTRIAFAAPMAWRENTISQDLYVVDISTSLPAMSRITSTTAAEGNPVFSPDGSKIAFARRGGSTGGQVVVVSLVDRSEIVAVGGETDPEHPEWGTHGTGKLSWLDDTRVAFRQTWSNKRFRGAPEEYFSYDLGTGRKSLYETRVRTYDLEKGEQELTYRHDPETGEKTLIKTRSLGK